MALFLILRDILLI